MSYHKRNINSTSGLEIGLSIVSESIVMEEVKAINEANIDVIRKQEKGVESEEISVKYEGMSLQLNQDLELMAKDHE